MYVYIYVHTYKYTHLLLYINKNTYIYIYTYIYICVCTYLFIHIYTFVFIYIYIFTYPFTRTRTRTITRTNTHTLTHICIYMNMHIHTGALFRVDAQAYGQHHGRISVHALSAAYCFGQCISHGVDRAVLVCGAGLAQLTRGRFDHGGLPQGYVCICMYEVLSFDVRMNIYTHTLRSFLFAALVLLNLRVWGRYDV